MRFLSRERNLSVVVFLLLVVTSNLERRHGGNDLDSRRVDIVDVDKRQLRREISKHALDCSCN